MRDFSNYKPIDLERPQSNCCGVDVDPDYLICPRCKEHCAIEEPINDLVSSTIIKNLVKRYETNNQSIFELELELLVAVAQKEQMIEDHNLYMGAIKEEE